MKARAKKPHRQIRAFTGKIFVSYEWRPVPAGGEEEAARLARFGYLELLDDAPAAPVAPPPASYDATPSAEALAILYGLDLRMVAGSGVGGRILKSDVEAWLSEEE